MHKTKKDKKKIKLPPKKVIKRVLILLLILIAIILLIITNPTFRAKMRLEKINRPDTMDETMPVPDYLSAAVAKYDGELTPQIIAKTYYNFSNVVIPKYYKKCKEMPDEKIEKYFGRHKKIIKIELGFTSSEEFKSFIKLIQTLNGEKLEFENYRILSDTVHKENNIINCYLIIKYKNNEEIVLNSQILNNIQKAQTSILYSANTDKEKLEDAKKYEKEQEETLNNYNSPFKRGVPLDILE